MAPTLITSPLKESLCKISGHTVKDSDVLNLTEPKVVHCARCNTRLEIRTDPKDSRYYFIREV